MLFLKDLFINLKGREGEMERKRKKIVSII